MLRAAVHTDRRQVVLEIWLDGKKCLAAATLDDINLGSHERRKYAAEEIAKAINAAEIDP